MANLHNDIKKSSAWAVKAFAEDNLRLNYTIDSFKDIDKFFDLHSTNGTANEEGRLTNNLGSTLFSIGSYIGETFIRLVPGSVWVIDNNDPKSEINAGSEFIVSIPLKNG